MLVCLVTLFILALLPFAHGAEEDSLPWKISADQITHQREPEKIIAEGKVLLQQYKENTPTGLEIEADTIQYNVDINSVDAVGNLHLRDNYDEVRASGAQIDLEKQIGFFKEATIFWQDTNLSASAELIEKTDLKSYHFVNGKLTTCPPEDDKAPAWSIWGRDVEITLDDYAKLKHATFRIKDLDHTLFEGADSLRDHQAEFGQQGADEVTGRGQVIAEVLANPFNSLHRLLVDCFRRNKPGGGLPGSDSYCQGIGRIGFVSFTISVSRTSRYEQGAMAHSFDHTSPVMGGRAGLHRDSEWMLARKPIHHLLWAIFAVEKCFMRFIQETALNRFF